MKKYLFFDTETTGLHAANFDRMLSIAFILTDEKGRVIEQYNKLIKPNGFTINEKGIAFEINGISNKIANEKGEDLSNVLDEVCAVIRVHKPVLIAHNLPFDFGFLMSELIHAKHPAKNRQLLMKTKSFCTAEGTKDILKLEGKRGYRRPKLVELYRYCFNKNFENHHDAMADTQALKDSFFELIKRKSLVIY